jgi:hypothetical protein
MSHRERLCGILRDKCNSPELLEEQRNRDQRHVEGTSPLGRWPWEPGYNSDSDTLEQEDYKGSLRCHSCGDDRCNDTKLCGPAILTSGTTTAVASATTLLPVIAAIVSDYLAKRFVRLVVHPVDRYFIPRIIRRVSLQDNGWYELRRVGWFGTTHWCVDLEGESGPNTIAEFLSRIRDYDDTGSGMYAKVEEGRYVDTRRFFYYHVTREEEEDEEETHTRIRSCMPVAALLSESDLPPKEVTVLNVTRTVRKEHLISLYKLTLNYNRGIPTGLSLRGIRKRVRSTRRRLRRRF